MFSAFTFLNDAQRDIATHPPVCVQLDLAQLATLPQKIADILAIHGHIDILVNNGGISVRADVLGTGVDIDVQVMQVCIGMRAGGDSLFCVLCVM